jgi:hypothetical protein
LVSTIVRRKAISSWSWASSIHSIRWIRDTIAVSVRGDASFKTWLLTIAWRQAIDATTESR